MRFVSLIVLLLSLFAFASRAAAAEDRYFLRAEAGGGFPFLKNLNNELSLQGNAKVGPGYSFGISLGRTFAEIHWSVEVHFSAAFYPAFNYRNPDTTLTSKLQHYSYMAIARWCLRPEGRAFKPSLGAGIGYGLTNLVSGVGKLGAAEAVVTGRIDSAIRENVDLSIECSYYAGLQSRKFATELLDTYVSDVVRDSAGNVLEDRYASLDFRVGITVWLKQRMPQ